MKRILSPLVQGTLTLTICEKVRGEGQQLCRFPMRREGINMSLARRQAFMACPQDLETIQAVKAWLRDPDASHRTIYKKEP
jgi:hypothetical protein